MQKLMHTLWMACAVFSLVGSESAFAQADSMRHRQADSLCQSDAADVQRPPDAKGNRHYYHLADLANCPNIGAQALAAEWAHPPKTVDQITFLGTVSARLQDQRILTAATRAARNTAYSRVVRLAAVQALIGQYDPRLGVWYRYDNPHLTLREGQYYVALGIISDVPRTHPGTRPPTAADSAGIIETFRQLGQADPDDVVRKIAAYLAGRFTANDLPTADRGQRRR